MFTNGRYDPWSSGGVTVTLSPSLPSVFMDEAAHHLDLYWTNAADPVSVTDARKFQMDTVAGWLAARAAARV